MSRCILIIGLFLFTSCKKNQLSDCELLKIGLSNKDLNTVQNIIAKFSKDLYSSPTPQDQYGQKENLSTLAQRINDQCGFSATVFCYGCEYSLPPSSLLTIYINENGTLIQHTLQIAIVPGDYHLKCVAVD